MRRRAYSSLSYSNQTLSKQIVVAERNGTGSGKAFQKSLKTGDVYDRVRSALEGKKGENRDGNKGHVNEIPPPLIGKSKARSSQGGIVRGSSEYNQVVPYPVKADETEESYVEKAALLADESASECHKDRAIEEGSNLEIKPNIADSSNDVILNSMVSLNEEDYREHEDPEVVWAINVLDRIISYTRSCSVEQSTAPQSRESQAETIAFDRREPESKAEALVKDSAKHPGPPENIECSNLAVVQSSTISNSIQKSEDIESSRSQGLLSAGGDAESSEQSRFWSASEIELIPPIHDDTVVRASASVIAGQPKAQGQEVESNFKPRKFQWTCFTPGISREHEVHRRTNFYRHWKSRIGGSARYTIGKSCETDGDETHVPRISRELEVHRRTSFYRHWRSRIGGSARYSISKGYETDGDETHVPSISREHEVHRRANFLRHWRSRSARYTISKGYATDGNETHVSSMSREHEVHGRTSFYCHWRSRIGGSARYIIGKGYETDGEKTHVPKYRSVSRGQSLDRFVTLGKFLLDDDEPSQNLSVDM